MALFSHAHTFCTSEGFTISCTATLNTRTHSASLKLSTVIVTVVVVRVSKRNENHDSKVFTNPENTENCSDTTELSGILKALIEVFKTQTLTVILS